MSILHNIKTYTIEYFQELWELISGNKTKLLSLFLIILILIPAFILPQKDKDLLNIQEQSYIQSPIPSNFTLPSFDFPTQLPKLDLVLPAPKTPIINPDINITINGGSINKDELTPKNIPLYENTLNPSSASVADVDMVKDNLKKANKVRYEGKISWAENLKSNIYADKFNANSSIKITRNNKSYIKNVNEKTIMNEDNLLLVSRSVFEELGGDPASQKSIIVIIEQ